MQSYSTDKKKKVLYVITKSNFGGAQKYVYELATSLDSEKNAVTVALGGDGVLKEKLEAAGIPVIAIPFLERDVSLRKEWQVYVFLLKLLRKERYDIVHLNSSKIGGIGALAGRVAGIKKIIFTAHGWAFNESRSTLSKLFIKLSYWATLLLAHKTIAVSKAIKERVKNWPFVNNKIVVIYNGVKEVEFLEKEEARNELFQRLPEFISGSQGDPETSSGSHAVFIGTLAELHPIKGLDVLIHAAADIIQQHPDVYFFIFGEGSERENLKQQIAQLGIEDHVHLLGYVHNAPKYLTGLDIFTLPSRSEALSLAILEAGQAGLPIVATNVGGIPEVISDKENGLLVEKENAGQLSQALLTLIEDKNSREKYAQHISQSVTEKFSFAKMLEQTRELYY